ncbi:hypothetical protein F2Q68_00040687 [Brassica cretica]|uniref:Flavin-containing monooxygenase n=2 Tax=Brassica TaxID=3705 RepID=A0A8S9MH38_BRACR|nr:hypothetical protein F2Q68_00040687 [Brassica cretica]
MVRFETEVVCVEPEGQKWEIRSKSSDGIFKDEIFDSVVVCNGHYTEPRVAHVPGIDSWPGKQIHSHNYRVPDPFKDQVVVVIGNFASGSDISRDITGVAKEVHIASRSNPSETYEKLPGSNNLWLHSMIESARKDGSIIFKNGKVVQADTIVHCTGYKYHFPFLNTNSYITVEDNCVGPLYKHVFPPALAPTLSFIGLPWMTLQFFMFELQSKWVAAVLSGRVTLPSEDKMMEDVTAFYANRDANKLPKRYTHKLGECQVDYLNWIAEQVGAPPVENWREMGDCFSVSLPCDQVVNQFSQWLCLRGCYIHNLPENIVALQHAMAMLTAKLDDVLRTVGREEFTGRQQRISQVQVWHANVLTTKKKVDDLLSTYEAELQRLCLCGFCSKDLKLSYLYGRSVRLMLREVEKLSSQGGFDVVVEASTFGEVDEIPIQPNIFGQERMLEKAWTLLMEDGSGMLGLYGMGGVGKTTLLTQINNKFSEISDRFEVVIWVVVSKSATVRKIQRDIAQKVGLVEMGSGEKDENQRALDIYNVLRRRKFALLLDDIWEKVDLKAVGVPYPTRNNGCKVAFTTRSRDVCGRMGVDDPVEVSCLQPDESWDLFQRTVGENTLGSHPDIPELARKVARKCRGLPLALNVIGETMACKRTVHEWCHAVDVLTSSATEFSGMEDEILPVLKYSYDNLSGEMVRSCFLYCSLFPEDYHIDKERLVEYWIGEGFVSEKESRERTLNQGYEIVGTLVRACLLMEERKDKSYVKMHDVVREMALWISSDFGNQKERCVVRAGVGLREVPKLKEWATVRKMSLMNNGIEEIFDSHECGELTTLFLQKNAFVKISGEFFRCMPHLAVLDLSENHSLEELPEEISELGSLRYLDVSYTCVNQLPVGLWELKKLIHLNLEHMSRLGSILGISSLWNLRTLGLRGLVLDMRLVNELELLEHLQVVTIDISSASVVKPLLWSHRLSIKRCGMREIEIEKTTSSSSSSWNKIHTAPYFSNLSKVFITKCHGLKDLTWLLFAPNLAFLQVSFSRQLEDIINQEKAASVENAATIVPFRRLETLHLSALRGLERIYWNALPFPCLKVIHVEKCWKLRKLPLDSNSGAGGKELVLSYGDREWIEKLEWEDQATRVRFLTSCRWHWRATQ